SAYILVNIPEFRLYVIENEEEVFDIKVCAGRRRPANYKEQFKFYKRTKLLQNKPDDWETPNMYGEISYLVLNPTWNVPNSIIREEISRKVSKDSSYLESRNFKVYKDGVEVNLDEVITSEFTSDTIPYRIVQDSGPGNALGKIKFMFDNRFGIYLHDTPTRRPFSYSNRAVSHGCVRVEKPLQLAEFILKDHSKWNIDYLKIEIGKKVDDKSIKSEYYQKRSSLRNRKYSSEDKTTEVILDKKIPLFIDYYTAWVDNNGAINLRDDIYRRDKLLVEYLFPEE
ncbi:MAG: L,D-transpeptidase family protein, partial [Ignavibacteriaceae bacterium]|nr:L,D-transpeptidase family protein [Ignavibacteriaceae bacterium]